MMQRDVFAVSGDNEHSKFEASLEDNRMETVNVKAEARQLIDRLPDDSTWDDLMHEIYVRQVIEAGLTDSRVGRMTGVEQVRQEFGLDK
jgi:Tfp pilus assembly protein PilO